MQSDPGSVQAGAGSLEQVPGARLLPDLTPFRRSRDRQLIAAGELISNLGAQAAIVTLACPSLVRYDTADWLQDTPELEAVAAG